jgi:hypothetical protein
MMGKYKGTMHTSVIPHFLYIVIWMCECFGEEGSRFIPPDNFLAKLLAEIPQFHSWWKLPPPVRELLNGGRMR